jgi:GDP-4-dehydro-6-deoxy-D-mannose reductase
MSTNRCEQPRILITGGTGFVGTHLIRFLKSRTLQISVLAPSAGSAPVPEVRYYEIDIRDSDQVGRLVRELNPTLVYHLAAVSAIDQSWGNPRLTLEVNVLGTYNLFEAAMGLPCPARILNVSTSQVYARSLEALSEESSIGPENPYAASKAMAELLRVQYAKFTSGGIITARSFNHTGRGQPPTFVLPSMAKQFAEIELGLRPPKISVGNLQVRRDFTDVRDVVRAYCLLLEHGKPGAVYNVCSGWAVLLADIIDMFKAQVGIQVTLETEPVRVRSNEAVQILGSPQKIQRETGWSPQIPLQKTIEDLLAYWRSKCREEALKGP